MYDYALYGSSLNTLGTLGLIALVLAIAATVLAFIFIVPAKRRDQMGKFGKFLHDTCNFRYLIIEKILQALYIFATALTILIGFFMLFCTDWNGWMGGKGILLMILGPIGVRVTYELLMMAVLAVKNIISTNNKLPQPKRGCSSPGHLLPRYEQPQGRLRKEGGPRPGTPGGSAGHGGPGRAGHPAGE